MHDVYPESEETKVRKYLRLSQRTYTAEFRNTDGIGREMLFVDGELLSKALQGTGKNKQVDPNFVRLIHFRPSQEAIAKKKEQVYAALQRGVPPAVEGEWQEYNPKRDDFE